MAIAWSAAQSMRDACYREKEMESLRVALLALGHNRKALEQLRTESLRLQRQKENANVSLSEKGDC